MEICPICWSQVLTDENGKIMACKGCNYSYNCDPIDINDVKNMKSK